MFSRKALIWIAVASYGISAAAGVLLWNERRTNERAAAPSALSDDAGVRAASEDSDDLRGRVIALETAAERTANALEAIVKRLPVPPPTSDDVVRNVAKIVQDVGQSIALPYTEAAGGTSQQPIVAFMDPRCPYCRAGHATTKALAAEGRARVVYVPIGLLGADSVAAADAILAVSAIDARAGADLIDIFFESPRAVDAAAIDVGVRRTVEKMGKTMADFEAALPAGKEAAARIRDAYKAAGGNFGIPVYIRLSDGTLRGAMGFNPDGTGDAALRSQLGF